MLVNLAYLLEKPTGTTNYALNLLPHLASLQPTYLATPASHLTDYQPVPANMTAADGQLGHLRRLLWTQFRLPSWYRRQSAPLLFSPIPEAPLGTACRYVVTVHDLTPLRLPQFFSSQKWLHQHYVPRVLEGAIHIICDSQATADDIMRFYGLPAKKITPILLAYDASHFQPLKLPTQNYFLVLGRHAPYKNVGAAIAAFANLPQQAGYELWIAGPNDPRYTPDLKAQALELGLEHQVRFLEYVPYSQLPTLLNQAVALVFPTLAEGFGLPLLEAFACGTPVVAANLPVLAEVAGDAAWLVDPHNVGQISQAMGAIATRPQLRGQLSQAGLKRAGQFSWQKTGKQTTALLKLYL
ncbi:MAG: glycosyltransferase family 1 protein [Cyanobacteria bacterium J06629_9]